MAAGPTLSPGDPGDVDLRLAKALLRLFTRSGGDVAAMQRVVAAIPEYTARLQAEDIPAAR